MSAYNTVALGTYAELSDFLASRINDRPTLIVNGAATTPDAFKTGVAQADGLVSDFDGTLIVGNQWDALRQGLPPHLAAQDRAEAEAYFAGHNRSNIDDIRLVMRSVDRLVASGLMFDTLMRDVYELKPRAGSLALLNSFQPEKIALVSMGISNLIQRWLFYWSNSNITIRAVELRWKGKDGQFVASGRLETVVTDGNKGFAHDLFCVEKGLDPSRVIALGDSPTDIEMMGRGSIGILIVPNIDHDSNRAAARRRGLEPLWPRLHAILVSDSLEPLVELRPGA